MKLSGARKGRSSVRTNLSWCRPRLTSTKQRSFPRTKRLRTSTTSLTHGEGWTRRVGSRTSAAVKRTGCRMRWSSLRKTHASYSRACESIVTWASFQIQVKVSEVVEFKILDRHLVNSRRKSSSKRQQNLRYA